MTLGRLETIHAQYLTKVQLLMLYSHIMSSAIFDSKIARRDSPALRRYDWVFCFLKPPSWNRLRFSLCTHAAKDISTRDIIVHNGYLLPPVGWSNSPSSWLQTDKQTDGQTEKPTTHGLKESYKLRTLLPTPALCHEIISFLRHEKAPVFNFIKVFFLFLW